MTDHAPPRLARWLLEAATINDDRDAVLGDLHEEFESRKHVDGWSARAWYWQQALRSLGPVLRRRWPSPLHKKRSGAFMETLWQDVRFASRLSRRKPLVTIVAMLSLIVGISLATVVFAILNAAAIKPLRVPSPHDLVIVLEQRPTSVQRQRSYPDYLDIRTAQRSMVDVFGASPRQMAATIGGETAMVQGELVTGGYFSTLGIATVSGRPLGNTDDEPGQPPAVVISERVWKNWGRSLPLEAGETVLLNNATFAVVGIAPASFGGLYIGRRTDVWVPAVQRAIATGNPSDNTISTRTTSWLTVMGRRRAGVSDEVLNGDLMGIEQGVFPKWDRKEPRRIFAGPGSHGDYTVPASVLATLRTLLLATCVVLLVACANVANLLMARAAERGRELALRLALGASRFRLLRLLVVEATVLCAASAVVAVVLARAGADAASRLIVRFGEPVALDLAIDWRLLSFVTGLTLAAALVSSIVPAAQVLRTTRLAASADGGRGATSSRLAARLRSALLIGQFALSLALVVCALLLVRTVSNLRNAPTGFGTDDVVLIAASPGSAQWPEARASGYVSDGIDRLSSVPGARAAGFARVRPVNTGGSRMTITIPGYTPQPQEDMEINFNAVTGAYFDALGIRVIDGQVLPTRQPPIPVSPSTRNTPPAPPPLTQAVVNETMAKRYWPNTRAVGQRFYLGDIETGQPADVVGVVADVKYREMREEPRPSFYLPLAPRQALEGVFHVRLSGDAASAIPELRRTLAGLAPGVPITQVRTLRSQIDANITDDRLAMTVGTALAGAALLLAGIGLFSAMANMVGQRTKEIGVRVALGATGSSIQGLVLRHALAITAAGSILGLALASWATSITSSRLYGVGRFDVASFAMAAAVLAAVAIASALIPARRASRVDPVDALRHD